MQDKDTILTNQPEPVSYYTGLFNRQLEPGDHLCLLYENYQEKIASVIPFIHQGLLNNQKCIYISHTLSPETIAAHLSVPNMDIENYIASGQLRILTTKDVYIPFGYFDPDGVIELLAIESKQAQRECYSALRVTGEMGWALKGVVGAGRLIEYEALLNARLFNRYPCIALCQYDITRFNAETIKDVIRTHPKLIWKGQLMTNCYYIPPRELLSIDSDFNEVKVWLKHLEHKETLLESQEREARYKALFELGDNISEGIALLQDLDNKEGVIILASQQLANFTGYSLEELAGRSIFDFISPDDHLATIERYRKRLKNEPVPDLHESTIVRKDGKMIPVEATSANTVYKGQPADVIYIRDISQRKYLEKSLALERDRSLNYMDVANVIIVGLDKNLRINLINRKALKVLGYAKKAVMGKNWIDFFVPQEHKAAVLAKLEDLISGRTMTIDDSESPINILGEETRTITWHYSVVHDAKGNITGLLGSGEDTTNLRKAEEQVRQQQARLEQLVKDRTRALQHEVAQRQKAEEKLKQLLDTETGLRTELQEQIKEREKFLHIVAHELKTPLTYLLTASDLLTENLSQDKKDKLITQVNQGAIALSKRVNELFDLARGETGMLHINPRLFDPVKILSETAALFEPQARTKCIELITRWPEKLPLLWGDQQRINQVLVNLLDNAFKHTSGGGQIEILAEEYPGELLIFIRDTGTGIPAEYLPRLFNPQSELNNKKHVTGGLGLGLALSKILVEMHGGRIWAESQEGIGSKFSFTLPVKTYQELAE